ncbi:DNA methyltransferase [Virgibacillus oceani]|uniref:Methyltransferase n=1 Tax=Virgibacillus oceani TaxID=1479511 RepID=A0A917HEQ6_9BACI|nr:DNA methyltransferase [Virgibacillus oceani]GGG76746.1 restriction endonuclease subunit M [Virgibacillus oceani]
MTNLLYFGDNLSVIKSEIRNEAVDLIYLDPPFNSNRDYNQIFTNKDGERSSAQIKVFEDTWYWNNDAEKLYLETIKYYNNHLVSNFLISMRQFLGTNQMLAYLTMMAPRLLEMYRVLKPNGVLFLHCDPSASHYLKLLLDAVFGFKNFENEIIWCYRQGGRGKRNFAKKHDTIYFYAKNKEYTFNADDVRVSYEGTGGYINNKNNGGNLVNGKLYKPNPNGKIPEDWWDIPALTPTSKERVGYPTQKPLKLLERIISASSNPGDVILDPFCGCGTAVVAAEKLGRKWIGIDITHIAITTIKDRLIDEFGLLADFNIQGEPVDIEGAEELAKTNRFQFQIWALSLLGMNYKEDYNSITKGADGGIDGIRYFENGKEGNLRKSIIQVKSGKVSVKDIRELNTVIDYESADMGVFVSLRPPTRNMVVEAARSGFFTDYKGNDFPKIRIVEVKDLLSHKIMPFNIFPS